jgi:integrase
MGVIMRQKIKGKGNPWWVFVSHHGKRTSRKVGTKASAQEVAKKIEAKLSLGDFDFEKEKPIPTFKDYADAWIKTTVPATCKESTLNDYKAILKIHVLPVFRDIRLTDITRGKIKDFLLEKTNKGYAGSTVTHMKNVISGILNRALDNEVIYANPAHRLGKFMKAKDKRESIDPLTKDELKKLLHTVQTNENLQSWYPLFLLLARTGLRIGEAIGLKWSDIDFNGRFIHIQRGISRGKIEAPKNSKTRKVDMSAQLTETLKAYQVECKKKGLALGLGDAPEYIFINKNGSFVDKDNWRRRIFNKALEKAELRRIRIHDLRHTYATLRISKGDNIQDVSNQLGHYSVKLTLDVYSHWMPGKQKAEVDALDEIYTFQHNKPLNER